MLAILLVRLSAATVILQTTPLVVVAGAALVFGEEVGRRRWVADTVGLISVVIIIQPGTDAFSLLSMLAAVGMLGFAGRDLASRAAPASLGTPILGLHDFLSIVVAGVLFSFWQAEPFSVPGKGRFFYLLGAGVAAYSRFVKTMRTDEVSAVTPFRYTRLIFGTAQGVFVFGELLSSAMVVVSGPIALSGLFTLWQGKETAGYSWIWRRNCTCRWVEAQLSGLFVRCSTPKKTPRWVHGVSDRFRK